MTTPGGSKEVKFGVKSSTVRFLMLYKKTLVAIETSQPQTCCIQGPAFTLQGHYKSMRTLLPISLSFSVCLSFTLSSLIRNYIFNFSLFLHNSSYFCCTSPVFNSMRSQYSFPTPNISIDLKFFHNLSTSPYIVNVVPGNDL